MTEEVDPQGRVVPEDKVYATFNEDGFVVGMYDMAAHDYTLPPGAVEITRDDQRAMAYSPQGYKWDAAAGRVVEWTPPNPDLEPPTSIALAPWRTGLRFWQSATEGRSRYDDVADRVKALAADTNMAKRNTGILAQEQLEYASTVQLAQLLSLKSAFGFTKAECIESMFRGRQVERGDLSGVWPLPPARA